jgi:predicted dehydrogenase
MAQKSVSTAMEAPKKAYKGKKLRVAIIGCGGIAQTHLHNFKNIPEVEVVAGVDVDIERLKIMRDTWGIPEDCLFGASFKTGKTTSQTGWVEMLKKMGDRIDAVDVCTPNGVALQAPVVDACNAGKPRLRREADGDEPRRVREDDRRRPRRTTSSFPWASSGATRPGMHRAAARRPREGQSSAISCSSSVQALRRRGIPNWGVFGQKALAGRRPDDRHRRTYHRVRLRVHGLPEADRRQRRTCWTYHGQQDRGHSTVRNAVAGTGTTRPTPSKTSRSARFASITARIMQIESSFAAHVPEEKHCFSAIGTRAGCKWPDPVVYTDQNNTMVDITPHYLGDDGWDAMFTAKLKDWASGCLKGTELSASGEDGLNVQKILDGVYRSAAAGKEVAIK